MKVLILTQFFAPEPVPIPSEIADSLVERGHSVRVLTGFPNYPSGTVSDGYRQQWRFREWRGSVRVLRVPLFADHSQGAVKRIVNYASFALSALSARSFARDADVIYVYATPMTAGLPAWFWRITCGAPYVLHVQDLWPDSVVGSSMVESGGAARAVDRVLSPWLRSMYRRAAAVVGIAPTMVSTLVKRGSPKSTTTLIYNWAGADVVVPHAADRSEPLRFVYAGNVGDMQDLSTVVRAAHAARDAGIEVEIVGDGVARPGLQALVAELGATNVTFHDPVPREQMGEVYARTDIALVTLKDLPVFRGTIPSKFQAVLAVGLPVLTTIQGDVRDFVEANDLGFSAAAGDVDSLEQAIRRASVASSTDLGRMRENAIRAYKLNFSRESGMDKIEEVLIEAVSRRGGVE